MDVSGFYELRSASCITLNWGTGRLSGYTLAFIPGKLRLTLHDASLGNGWTLTLRK